MRVFTVPGMETRKQQFKSAVSDAIVHLQGSEEALAPFGWTGEKAGAGLGHNAGEEKSMTKADLVEQVADAIGPESPRRSTGW